MKVNFILQMEYIFFVRNDVDQFLLSHRMNSLA